MREKAKIRIAKVKKIVEINYEIRCPYCSHILHPPGWLFSDKELNYLGRYDGCYSMTEIVKVAQHQKLKHLDIKCGDCNNTLRLNIKDFIENFWHIV